MSQRAASSGASQVDAPEHTTHEDDSGSCPLSHADDKFAEAHHFLDRMMRTYHEPHPFRWNLNAFIQALRSVTFIIQKCLRHFEGFEAWWPGQQDLMREDKTLRAFVEGRNIVVKERSLLLESRASIGMYRNRLLKLAVQVSLSPYMPSAEGLELAKDLKFVPESHPWIGEEYGVRRDWRSSELGDGNILVLCDDAWVRIGVVMAAAHRFAGRPWDAPVPHVHRPELCDLLTETDLDPSLPAKWGWV